MDFLKNTVLVETGFGEQQGLITVVDKAIGQADAHKADGAAGLFQYPGNFRSGSADQHILFDADQQGMFRSQLQNQFTVDGFDKAHVGDGGIQFFGGGQCRGKHRAKGQQGDLPTLAANLALAEGERAECLVRFDAHARATRVAYGRRALMVEGRGQHPATFVFVGGGHQHHVRNAGDVGKVESAVMRRAVGSDQPAPV